MRRSRIIPSELLLNRVERFLRLALPRDDAERPVRNFLASCKPFIRPGEKNRSGQTAFHHAVNVPDEQFGLLILRTPDRVLTDLRKTTRMLAGEILQPQQVTFEIALIVKQDAETGI